MGVAKKVGQEKHLTRNTQRFLMVFSVDSVCSVVKSFSKPTKLSTPEYTSKLVDSKNRDIIEQIFQQP